MENVDCPVFSLYPILSRTCYPEYEESKEDTKPFYLLMADLEGYIKQKESIVLVNHWYITIYLIVICLHFPDGNMSITKSTMVQNILVHLTSTGFPDTLFCYHQTVLTLGIRS
jgi:hypothetical protein